MHNSNLCFIFVLVIKRVEDMYKELYGYGITIALIVLAVISIKFMWIGVPIIALTTYAIGRFVGKYLTEPQVVEKVVEKIVEVPVKNVKKKSKKTE